MSTTRTVARNMIWNWAGTGVNMLVGFVLVPFLLNRLGDAVYGLWILIASLTSYYGLLDLGVRGSVGRYVALHRAEGDVQGINMVLNTALALLLAPAAAALLLTPVAIGLFFHFIPVPAADAAAVQASIWIVALSLAVSLPMYLFDGLLWGFERFDLLNAVDIPVILGRTGITFYFIGRGHGLVALAVITILTTLVSGLMKGAAALYIHRTWRPRWSLVNRDTARTLFGYGTWQFMLSIARIINTQLGPWVIGALAVPLVPAYSIASRLVGYAVNVLIASTGILTPLATKLHARKQERDQRELHVQGSAFAMAIALFFVVLFIFMGRILLRLWMRHELANAWSALAVLALGELLPMSQWATQAMLLGMARHRLMALVALAEGLVAIVLIRALVHPYGLMGVCIALSVAATACRGLFPLIYGTRLVNMPLRTYLARAIFKPIVAAALPAAGLAALAQWKPPASLLQFLLCVVGYAVCYTLAAGGLLGGYQLYQLLRPPRPRTAVSEAVPALEG